jgi:hypothetical protein
MAASAQKEVAKKKDLNSANLSTVQNGNLTT